MRKSKIMKALLVFGMSMVTATAICFTACDNGDSNDGNDTDIVDTDTGNNQGGNNQGGNNQGGTEEKSTEVTEAEWKQIIESTTNYTCVETTKYGSVEIKVDGNKLEITDDGEDEPMHQISVKNAESYDVYVEVDSVWVKITYSAEQAEEEYVAEMFNYYQGILKTCKDDYHSFTYANGKYTAETLDKTKTLQAILKNVEVTFSDGALVGVKLEVIQVTSGDEVGPGTEKPEAPKDENNEGDVGGTPEQQADEPTEVEGEGTIENPGEEPGEEPGKEPAEDDPIEITAPTMTINYEIKGFGSTTVSVPKVDGEANVLGTYYTYWFDDDKGGWKYAGGEDIVVKDDGTCVVDGDDATYEIEESGVVKVNVNGGQIYAKIEDKIMWLFKTAADADDYTKAMGFAYNGTVISTEDKEKVEENTGKGFVTEGGETPGPSVDLGAYVGTYYTYWLGDDGWKYGDGEDIVVKDDGTCVVDGDPATYVVDENGVVNVDSGSVYVKIEDKIMWLYENIDSIGDYANAMSFAYKGSNEIPADVKLMIEKITGKGFATEDPGTDPGDETGIELAFSNVTRYGGANNDENVEMTVKWDNKEGALDMGADKQFDAAYINGTLNADTGWADEGPQGGDIHQGHLWLRGFKAEYDTKYVVTLKKGDTVVATGTLLIESPKSMTVSSDTENALIGNILTLNPEDVVMLEASITGNFPAGAAYDWVITEGAEYIELEFTAETAVITAKEYSGESNITAKVKVTYGVEGTTVSTVISVTVKGTGNNDDDPYAAITFVIASGNHYATQWCEFDLTKDNQPSGITYAAIKDSFTSYKVMVAGDEEKTNLAGAGKNMFQIGVEDAHYHVQLQNTEDWKSGTTYNIEFYNGNTLIAIAIFSYQ